MQTGVTAGLHRAAWLDGIPTGLAVGLAILGGTTLVALFGPSLVPNDPLVQELAARNAPPDALHWLGRDHLGRDILARLAAGTRISLAVALGATLLVLLLGAMLGLVAEGRRSNSDTPSLSSRPLILRLTTEGESLAVRAARRMLP